MGSKNRNARRDADVTPPPQESGTLGERLNLGQFVLDLANDLTLLRTGRISVREAHARAELARQFLRGVHYVVLAQKFIEGNATALPAPADQST